MYQYNEAAVNARYGKQPSEDVTLGYLKALKIIIGADGEIAPKEAEALRKGMNRLGVSDEIVGTIERFKIKGVTLAEVLPNLTPGGKRAKLLIRDAIEICRADGVYAQEEKNAVYNAAKLLGVDEDTVRAIQSLVEMEHAVKRLRKALL
jgi:uncharacterized tellurite resistance protein B-like protein